MSLGEFRVAPSKLQHNTKYTVQHAWCIQVHDGLVCTYIEVQQCTKYRMVLPMHFILYEWIYSVAWHGMVPSTEWSLWCIQGLYYSTEYQVWSYQVPSMLQLVLVKLIIIRQEIG